jgi:hypothetical protein
MMVIAGIDWPKMVLGIMTTLMAFHLGIISISAFKPIPNWMILRQEAAGLPVTLVWKLTLR